MERAKRMFLAGALICVGISIGGCVYYVRGPYPLITIHHPGDYRHHHDRDCRYRECNR
jgi:hypothetical protein